VSEPFNIALIGCGTVGSGVAWLLVTEGGRLEARAGRPLVLRTIVIRDSSKARPAFLSPDQFTTDLRRVLDDPSIHVAAELVGGVSWARHAVLELLAAGKHVVTANKALLAQHGPEIFEAARRHGRAVAFEASVGGGIPIIAALSQGLAANEILALQGILNGTCNFILTSMTEQGLSYQAALAEAQRRGYAEADPTLDVDGTDAAHKLAILAQIAFGIAAPVEAIERRGIVGLQEMDIRYAGELGYTIKLLAESWLDATLAEGSKSNRRVSLHVSPVLLRHHTPLAQVRGAYNAIQVVGDAVGDTLYYGQGAGQMPTASAVVADLIDLAVGRAQRTFQTMNLWSGQNGAVGLRPAASVRTRFYLRLMILDQPGVLAEIARILAQHHVSISSVIQHEAPDDHEGDTVPLVIMTHTVATGNFRAAIADIDHLGPIAAMGAYFPVAD
jgi:homoserine dehydrogenase